MQVDRKSGEKKRVTISIEIEVHQNGNELAAADRRSFSSLLEVLIEERYRQFKAATRPEPSKEVA